MIVPDVHESMPPSMFSSVVLPAPEGPTTTTNSPRSHGKRHAVGGGHLDLAHLVDLAHIVEFYERHGTHPFIRQLCMYLIIQKSAPGVPGRLSS